MAARPTPTNPTDAAIRAVEALPLTERLRVIEAISRSVREEVAPVLGATPQPSTSPVTDAEDWQATRARILADVPPDSSLHRIVGALRRDGVPVPMTREEEHELITEAIMEKHLR